MRSKITLLGHPIHPMLVGFPLVLYTLTLAALVVYLSTGNVVWFRGAIIANLAAVIAAVVAAIPGFTDWWLVVPRATAAKQRGLTHMFLNLGALLVFAANLWVMAPQWSAAAPENIGLPILLSVVGLGLAFTAAFQGWNLVQYDHVGIEEHEHREEPLPTEVRRGERRREVPPEPPARHPE